MRCLKAVLVKVELIKIGLRLLQAGMRSPDTGTAVEYLWIIHLTAEEGIPEAFRRFHRYSCIRDGILHLSTTAHCVFYSER